MIDPANVPDVGSDELLARYVLQRSHIRGSDQTLKPDAFIPHPHTDLSVTRHILATDAEVWSVGQQIAGARGRTLYGRGDFRTAVCLKHQLVVRAAPIEGNPNHADVSGWPGDKPAQKSIAQEIAAVTSFVPTASALS